MKIIFFSNTSWYLFNFRLSFLKKLQKEGHEISLVAPEDPFSCKLQESGFKFIPIKLNRSAMNPIGELRVLYSLYRIYREEKPDLVHHYTVKCVLYGSIVGSLHHVKAIVNSITGLGHVFLSNSLSMRVVRFFLIQLYRFFANKKNIAFLFQNSEDQKLFAQLGIVSEKKSYLVRGSGVDTKKFQPTENLQNNKITLLFASRLLKEKGLLELMEALRILKNQNISFEFLVAGFLDKGNPSFISEDELNSWVKEGLISYLGALEQIEQELARADIVVLPSWREGLPKILIEAGAAGKAIVATDVPGCRDVVEDKISGLLVPLKNPIALATAMNQLISDSKLRERLGMAARKKVLEEFDQELVHEKTIQIYKFLFNQS